jgi:hypothetical protein
MQVPSNGRLVLRIVDHEQRSALSVSGPRAPGGSLSSTAFIEEVVTPDAKSVASDCLQAWTNGDFETARSLIDDEVTFAGPFGTAQGADAYLDGLRRFRDRGVETAEIQRAFQDGDEACLIYDLVTNTPAGTIPTVGWYRLGDGKIVSVRAFFDARPLAPPSVGPQG